MECRFRHLEPGDIEQCRDILRGFFGENYYGAHPRFMDWQYRDAPFSSETAGEGNYTILGAMDGDSILALDAFMPWKTYVDGEPVSTIWDIEWMNAAKVKGLGRKLMNELRPRYEMYCGYGLNSYSRAAYVKLGYRVNDSIERMIAVLDAERCIEEYGISGDADKVGFYTSHQWKSDLLEACVIPDLAQVDDRYWQEAIKRFKAISYKGLAYLQWRFLDHPFLKYHLVSTDPKLGGGYAAVRLERIRDRRGVVLRVLDMLPMPGRESELVRAVLTFGQDNKALMADFFCTSPEYARLVCPEPFLPLSAHLPYDVPMLFQPLEVRERKSINMVWDVPERMESISFADFYATKADGDQDVFVNEDYRTVSL